MKIKQMTMVTSCRRKSQHDSAIQLISRETENKKRTGSSHVRIRYPSRYLFATKITRTHNWICMVWMHRMSNVSITETIYMNETFNQTVWTTCDTKRTSSELCRYSNRSSATHEFICCCSMFIHSFVKLKPNEKEWGFIDYCVHAVLCIAFGFWCVSKPKKIYKSVHAVFSRIKIEQNFLWSMKLNTRNRKNILKFIVFYHINFLGHQK